MPADDDDRPALQLFDRTVLALLAVALLIRVALVLATRDSFQLVNDPADYHRLALSISNGDGFGESVVAGGGGPTAFRAPAYPTLLGGLYAVIGEKLTAARLLQAVGGTLTVALLYVLAYRLFGRRVALVAAGIAAVYPPLVITSATLISEVIFLPLVLGALIAVFRARSDTERPNRWAVVAGVLLGLACLTRSIGLVLIPIAALLLWTRRPRWSIRALAPSALAAVVALGVIAPWTIRNAVELDRFVPVTTSDAFTLVGPYNDQARTDKHNPSTFRPYQLIPEYAPLYTDRSASEAEVYDRLREGAVDYMKDHPSYVATTFARNFARLYDLDGLGYARIANRSIGFRPRVSDATTFGFWLAAAVALVGIFTAGRRRAPILFWLIPVAFTAMTAIAVGTTRYRMPIEPFVVLLAGLGVVSVFDRVRGRGSDRA